MLFRSLSADDVELGRIDTSGETKAEDFAVFQTAAAISQSTLQQQISIAVLARANTDAGHLNSFLSVFA